MEILDKKSNRVSRVIVGVFEANLLASFAEITANSWFLSLRDLLSNELFFTFYYFATVLREWVECGSLKTLFFNNFMVK